MIFAQLAFKNLPHTQRRVIFVGCTQFFFVTVYFLFGITDIWFDLSKIR